MNPEIKKLELGISELNRKIEEEDYEGSCEGFEDEFYALRELADDLSHASLEYNEIAKVKKMQKQLDKIRDDNGLYNEADELERLFPNGNEEDFDN